MYELQHWTKIDERIDRIKAVNTISLNNIDTRGTVEFNFFWTPALIINSTRRRGELAANPIKRR